jgi:thiol:disulfide interchange protein DsbC
VDWAKLPLDKAIVKVKGKGERKVALFSDPDCPYCQQLERELMDVDNVTIYIFLYPLTTIHPDAERKARLVWCAPDRARAWDELMLLKREPAGPADCATPFKEIAEFADKSWILGTPGIVFSSGQLVPGAINRQQFEQLL